MTEKKLKPAAKKATSSKVGTGKSDAASGKSRSIKKAVATPPKNTAAKKPVSKKATTKPDKAKTPAVRKETSSAAEKKSPARKSPVKRAAPPKTKPTQIDKPVTIPTPEERYRMVETAAYFIAEQHGFQGHADEHWAAAEREIAARIGCAQTLLPMDMDVEQ